VRQLRRQTGPTSQIAFGVRVRRCSKLYPTPTASTNYLSDRWDPMLGINKVHPPSVRRDETKKRFAAVESELNSSIGFDQRSARASHPVPPRPLATAMASPYSLSWADAPPYHYHGRPQPAPDSPASSDGAGPRSLWIGGLLPWMDEDYLYGCFTTSREVRPAPASIPLIYISCCLFDHHPFGALDFHPIRAGAWGFLRLVD
jgi:hypothetical protein